MKLAGFELHVDHPVEIVMKKLYYRGTLCKARDAFDIAVIYKKYMREMIAASSILGDKLDSIVDRFVAMKKSGIWEDSIEREVLVLPEWQWLRGCEYDICMRFFEHAKHLKQTGKMPDDRVLRDDADWISGFEFPVYNGI